MSEIESLGYEAKRTIEAGLVVDVAEEGLSRVQKLLAGIEGGWQRAVGSALARAGSSGKTAAKSAVSKEYFITQSEFLRRTKNINHFVNTGTGVEVVFGFAGHVIPLLRFDTHYGNDGRVTTRVKRESAKEALDHAFVAHMGSHTGVYERLGKHRFPIRQFYGPATPQMMYSNENVMDEIEEKVVETYEKRIDHEISRIINGWGV